MAVRATASLCVHLARGGGCALLLPGDRRPTSLARDLAAWPAAHARLALVSAVGSKPPLERARRAGAVIWVSAAGEPPRDLARAAAAGGWLVSPSTGAGRADFTVAGCTGTRLRHGTGPVPSSGLAVTA